MPGQANYLYIALGNSKPESPQGDNNHELIIESLTRNQTPFVEFRYLHEKDWNNLRIRVEGDNVKTWLNGEEMVDLTDDKFGKGQGRIALQIHSGGGIKVLWKNFKMETL